MDTPTVLDDWDSNFTAGRGGYTPVVIVDHIEAGTEAGTDTWFHNPASDVSSHYSVAKDGTIRKHVKVQDTAWACGVVDHPTATCVLAWFPNVNPNKYTVSIEHEGYPGDTMPEPQYQSTLWLHQQIIGEIGAPVDDDHIIPHSSINADHAQCPGPTFPWARLFSDLHAWQARAHPSAPSPV